MKRVIGIQLSRGLAAMALALASGVLMHGTAARAAGLNYVDADDVFLVNIAPAAGGPLSDAVNTTAAVGDDNKWGYRAFGNNANIFESGVGNEDALTGPPPETDGAPALVQTITGLNAGSSYDLYTAFWTNPNENWNISTGTSLGNMTIYSYRTTGTGLTPGAVQSKNARGSAWDTPPVMFTEGGRVLLLGKAGTAVANGSGEVQVFIDDVALGGSPTRRSWLDGVAWVENPTPATEVPVSIAATVNRATGNFTLTNPTMQSFDVKKIDIVSASGSLNSTTWQSISGPNASFDADPWTVTAPLAPSTYTTLLSEQEAASGAGSGGTLVAGSGTLNLGNIWQRNPFEDLRIDLTFTDDSVAQIFPTFTGVPVASGDFDGNGAINTSDYQTLMTNLHGSLAGLTLAESYARGDMVSDAAVDYYDFAAFRTAYDAVNGSGSFAQMVSQIPEPATAGMLLMAGIVCARYVRGMRRHLVMAGLLCCVMATSSQAQAVLKIDVDSRAGDSSAGPPGDNTVAGFGSFTLTPATTGAQPSSTATVNGYDITVLAVNSAGNPQPGIDDRDRGTPVSAPTLNQLYDDFIFTAGGVGVGGGIDLTVQGGALQPNTAYDFSMYSFDTGSTGVTRTADWLDGNRGNVRSYSTKFAGTNEPTTDDQYKFTGVAVTDASGRLLLRGRNTTPLTSTGGIQPGVFVNGFEVAPFTGLTLEVNSTTGAVRLLNEQASPIQLSYYEIGSASGALNAAAWSSLDDGEGGDPFGTGWDEAGGSDANILSEGNLTSMLTLAASGGSASLGSAFSAGGMQDIFFSYAAPGAPTLRGGLVKYVTGGGGGNADFDDDGDVDGRDFLTWQRALGSTVANGTGADGSGNGVVDAADLTLWEAQFGNGAATAVAAAIPEPAGLALAAVAGLALAASRRRVTSR
ncbi:MAG TPA: hypothetical protein VF175_03830 [Lacipirellula sp.]